MEDTIQLFTEKQAAEMLTVPFFTLRNLRLNGRGPKFIRFNERCIRYKLEDLKEWLDGKQVEP